MIEVSGLLKSYPLPDGRRLEVLRGVSMSVAKGEAVAIMGASGSGKTTLLHILAGLEEGDGGSATIGHTRACESGARAGLIFQLHYLLPELSAEENVALAARLAGCSRSAATLLARERLREVGLAERAGHMPSELSGGEIARVAIARALASGSEVLLADEPTGSLDEETSRTVQKILFETVRRGGKTLVIVTHDGAVAAQADRILRLEKGRTS